MRARAGLLGCLAFTGVTWVAPATAQISNAPPSCPKETAAARAPRWFCLTIDLRADRRARSNRAVAVAEPDRDEEGPGLSVYRARLGPDRPISRSLFDTRIFGDIQTDTAAGELRASLGVRAQLETPPRRRHDPANRFNRTGRRLALERASVTLGAWSAGYMPSAFYFTPSLSYTTGYATEQSTTSLAYLARLSDAWSLTLAIEDPEPRRITDSSWGDYRRSTMLDPVLALRRRFRWGTAQLAAAAHPVRASARAPCCGDMKGSAVGWAAMGGVEAWVDSKLGGSELLLNVSASKGALDYLNATDYPADFALANDGHMDLTSGGAAVASIGHYWTPRLRTVLSLSAARTDLRTDRFRLRVDGRIAQGAVEYVVRPALILGFELGYYHDRVRAAGAAEPSAAAAGHTSAVVYVRKRIRKRFGS